MLAESEVVHILKQSDFGFKAAIAVHILSKFSYDIHAQFLLARKELIRQSLDPVGEDGATPPLPSR